MAETGSLIRLWEDAGLTRPWNDPQADIRAALGSACSAILVAREGPALVGSVMVGYDGHRGWFYYLAVATTHRRRGIGRALVEAAEAWLAARGAPAVRLMVRTDNPEAAAFYAAIGYEQSEVIVMGRRFPAG